MPEQPIFWSLVFSDRDRLAPSRPCSPLPCPEAGDHAGGYEAIEGDVYQTAPGAIALGTRFLLVRRRLGHAVAIEGLLLRRPTFLVTPVRRLLDLERARHGIDDTACVSNDDRKVRREVLRRTIVGNHCDDSSRGPRASWRSASRPHHCHEWSHHPRPYRSRIASWEPRLWGPMRGLPKLQGRQAQVVSSASQG